ncbi:MAG: bifunctional oligoribonuclease/PAP phosphatase NrnA [Heliobacteriaceae bacterium]|nr:bifunctional oligoribonuclease/PAP phosphatase NrnA [Heliobacteriaceae bacterium]
MAVHQVPDGDALGSLSALLITLQAQDKSVVGYCDDPVPRIYRYLPGINQIFNAGSLPDFIPELAVVMDCADQNRLGEGIELVNKAKCIINIDHHLGNSLFGHLNWVDANAAACGEQICQLFQQANWPITTDVATALYTSLATDTGSFQFANTTSYTLRLAADLRDKGAQVQHIMRELYESKPLRSLRLLTAILPTLQLSADGRIAWMQISRAIMDQLGATQEDCENLVSYPRSLEGVDVALIFREIDPETIRVGLRSKDIVDVNRVARLFGGGGHRRAAGCTLQTNLAEAKSRVITVVESMLLT